MPRPQSHEANSFQRPAASGARRWILGLVATIALVPATIAPIGWACGWWQRGEPMPRRLLPALLPVQGAATAIETYADRVATRSTTELPRLIPTASSPTLDERVGEPSPPPASTPALVDGSNERPDPLSISADHSSAPQRLANLEAVVQRRVAVRAAQAAAAAAQATEHDRRGFELANRGALFAARSEFTAALRVVAAGYDADNQTQNFSLALAAGLRALDEAEDFQPRSVRVDDEFDLKTTLSTHRTPVLQGLDVARLSPAQAHELYVRYAIEQLSGAGAGELAAAHALCSLGKLHGLLAAQKPVQREPWQQRALAYYQAALVVAPGHPMATNDLAVLLADRGRYFEAERLLVAGLQTAPHAALWNNLSAVQLQLGQQAAADQSRRAAEAVGGWNASSPAMLAWRSVRWVDPAQLAASTQPASDLQRPLNSATAVGQPAAPSSAAPTRSAPNVREARQRGRNWLN